MSDEVFLVCARADMPFTARGSDFTHHCSECHTRVMIAPSGIRKLKSRPEMQIICVPCLAKKPAKDLLFEMPDKEVLAELREGDIPNFWRKRN